ncbi:unnamed protein product [marine sediment metagenome]|uniref:Uncharacterized protein n=1 Tax=marine sediment metagenome TaxID=412755 RepID=X1NFR3_9ZZZZ
MSYSQIKRVAIVPNQPRDFHIEHEGTANYSIDLVQEHRVIGLDWALFNTGAAAITIAVDGGTPITVPAGSSRGFNNIKYATLKVVAAVAFTVLVAGVNF